jgi:hypothetical protein
MVSGRSAVRPGPRRQSDPYTKTVKHWAHRRRLLAACAVLVIAAALLAVWAAASSGAKPPRLATYRNSFVTFRYPAAWSPSVWQAPRQMLHFHPMVFLSTQPTHDPCSTSSGAGGTSITCGWPIDRLAPGGVVVRWENRGSPDASLATFPGLSTDVGGRRAKLSTQRPGSCGGLGADKAISVAIARPMASNWTAFEACLRGPLLAEHERQVRALLSSTRFLLP